MLRTKELFKEQSKKHSNDSLDFEKFIELAWLEALLIEAKRHVKGNYGNLDNIKYWNRSVNVLTKRFNTLKKQLDK